MSIPLHASGHFHYSITTHFLQSMLKLKAVLSIDEYLRLVESDFLHSTDLISVVASGPRTYLRASDGIKSSTKSTIEYI